LGSGANRHRTCHHGGPDLCFFADLRFTPNEVATFLNAAVELDLAREDVDVLAPRTEGRIADLQLAALSLRGRSDAHGFITAFSGGGTTKSGDMACPEVDLNHQSPLQLQCHMGREWAGILTVEHSLPGHFGSEPSCRWPKSHVRGSMVLAKILVAGLSRSDGAVGIGVTKASPQSACRQEDSDHKRIRTTNLLERCFLEERRRTKVIPRFFTEKSSIKLAFARLWRTSQRWQGVRMSDIERQQVKLLRRELDQLADAKQETVEFKAERLAA